MKIIKIEIFGFRGLREFNFSFQSTNALVIYGLNGTGKSSLFQALNFAITGNLPLVSSVNVSSSLIYRHKALDKNTPAIVCIHLSCSNCECWIKREIHSNGNIITYTSNNDPLDKCNVSKNSLCFLTKLDFSGMVDAVERDSWQKLSPFLGHEKLAKFREGLRSLSLNIKRDLGLSQIEDNVKREQIKFSTSKSRYEACLKQSEIEKFSIDILKNELKQLIPVVPEFNSIKEIPWDSMQLSIPGSDLIINISKQLQELSQEAAVSKMNVLPHEEFNKAVEFLSSINNNPQLGHDLLHEQFLSASSSAVKDLNEGTCPLCGMTPTDWNGVRGSLEKRLEKLGKSKSEFEKSKKCLDTYKTVLEVVVANITEWECKNTGRLELLNYREKLQAFCDFIDLYSQRLNSNPPIGISSTETKALENTRKEAINAHNEFKNRINNLENQLKQEQEKISKAPHLERFFKLKELSNSYLDLLEIHKNLKFLQKKEVTTAAVVEKTQSFFKLVNDAESNLSTQILTKLESEICRVFSVITDQGQLQPKINSRTERGIRLAEILIKDFHGLGPVLAREYLSEANRNSLGLSIYFAGLMNRSPKLNTLVIDDITHSADSIHRRGLSRFIVNELSTKFQLIILTHDKHWHERVLSTLPRNDTTCIEIIDWTPDGLTFKTDKWSTLLDKASSKIRNHDHTGGNALRQAIEKFIDEICEKLDVEFPYRQSTASISLNEKRQMLEKAIKDAWQSKQGIIDPNRQEIRLILNSQKITNFASHYGSYDLWDHQDLLEVLKDINDLLEVFVCKNVQSGLSCGALLTKLKKSGGNLPICAKCKRQILL